jgi:hypothetical protein
MGHPGSIYSGKIPRKVSPHFLGVRWTKKMGRPRFPGDNSTRATSLVADQKAGPTVIPAETILLSHIWYSFSSVSIVIGVAGNTELFV